jgi:hypothetical protein
VVEKHADGYVAYPLGLKGVVVGEGDTYEEALVDVKSTIRFHIETFGSETHSACDLRPGPPRQGDIRKEVGDSATAELDSSPCRRKGLQLPLFSLTLCPSNFRAPRVLPL